MHGADVELRGKDFAFIGDRKGNREPMPVVLNPDLPWKWITKRIVADSGPYEEFYAVPANKRKLWQPPDRAGIVDVTLPRILALPPPFVTFCTEAQRTPFELHQFVSTYASNTGDATTIDACSLIRDWCLLASHPDGQAMTSVLAITLQAAPADDDLLLDWLHRRLTHTIGAPVAAPPPPQPAAPLPPPPHATGFVPPPGQPPDIMWAQVAASLSQGMANVAAAMQPQGSHAQPYSMSTYEDSGKDYDEFQLAIL